MQCKYDNNCIDAVMDKHEFVALLIESGGMEAYSKGDVDTAFMKCAGFIHSFMINAILNVETEDEEVKKAAKQAADLLRSVHAFDVKIEEDDDNEGLWHFYLTPKEDVPHEAILHCQACFCEKVLPNLVRDIQSRFFNPDVELIMHELAQSECFMKVLHTFPTPEAVSGFAEWCESKIVEWLNDGSFCKSFYEMKELDHCMDVAKYVKRGLVLKRKDKYYLVSSKDYAVLNEYGRRIRPFIYSDEYVLCGIKDGQLHEKKELIDFFSDKPNDVDCVDDCDKYDEYDFDDYDDYDDFDDDDD